MKLKATGVILLALATIACYQPKPGISVLGNAHPLNGVRAYAMQVFQDKLFVGGSFDSAGGVKARNIATWDGTKWDSAGGGMRGYPFVFVDAFAVYKGELYAAGLFYNKALHANGIEKWNGEKWSAVGKGVSIDGYIKSMAEYNGNLYVVGDFDSIDGKAANSIAEWNGSTWSALPDSVEGEVEQMAVYRNRLYVTGDIRLRHAPNMNGLFAYNGKNWETIKLDAYFNSKGMWVYNDQLYVTGFLNGKAFTGKWDGNSVTSVNTGIDGWIRNTVMYHDKLIVAGLFARANGKQAHCIAEYNGMKSEPISLGFNSSSDTLEEIRKTDFLRCQQVVDSMGNVKVIWSSVDLGVCAMAVYHDQLYIGGLFDSVNGKPIANIVSWYEEPK